MHTKAQIEYRVRPVTRFIVTRFEAPTPERQAMGSSQHGEFDNHATAYAVAYALCSAERDRLGWGLSDERIRYPAPAEGFNVAPDGVPDAPGAPTNS